MYLLVYVALYGWIPAVFWIFQRFSPQQAISIAFVVAWLFLPVESLPISGLPDITKSSVTCYGIFLATLVFYRERIKKYRFSWLDLPILVWCGVPLVSSLTNGLGIYDGLSATLAQTVFWGLPYFLGRLYLNNLSGLRQIALAIFFGGLAYVPLCLFEIRMSPQLHSIVYGFFPHSFLQTYRLGGWRPNVFMQHGLAVGLWMMAATLTGIWLWRSGSLTKVGQISMAVLVPILTGTFILVKSTGAYGLLVVGMVIFLTGRWWRKAIVVYLLCGAIAFHIGANAIIPRPAYLDWVANTLEEVGVPPERIDSLNFRFENEELLAEKARYRLLFGWGGWGRSRIYDEDGNDISTTDSTWIIAYGQHGIVGLASWVLSLCLPAVVLFSRRNSTRLWRDKAYAPASLLATIVVLYLFDSLLNAMVNPVFILANGAVASFALSEDKVPQTRTRGLPSRAVPLPRRRQPRNRRPLSPRVPGKSMSL